MNNISEASLEVGGDLRIPSAVFRIWRNRQKIEIEAARIFRKLALEIEKWRGVADPVRALALKAADDEMRHEVLCREILALSPLPVTLADADTAIHLGPQGLTLSERVLYSGVAIGCVTETLSTALLIEMRKRAQPGMIRNTIHEILEDEVDHSRIGWAELALQSKSSDVSWLGPFISSMVEEALASEIEPMLSRAESETDLSAWGILSPKISRQIMSETISQVIVPGLRHFGVAVDFKTREYLFF